MIELAASLPTKALDTQHCEYTEHCKVWDDLDLLYRGGHAIRRQAERFLRQRPKEVADVYARRIERFSYQNILGTALGWYQSALFEEDPSITLSSSDAFYGEFLEDCNRAGKSFVNIWREAALDLMLYKSSWILTDLPRVDAEPSSREEQRVNGALDPYLVRYDPRQVINWECDAYGNLEWVVIATENEIRGFGKAPEIVDRWYVFDREKFARYEAVRDKDQKQKAEVAFLVDRGPHALTAAGQVPVQHDEIPDALWLANRAYLQVLDHLNADNAYAWALFMACLPVPVFIGEYKVGDDNGERPANQTISETAAIQLPEGGDFKFTEPAGTSFQHSADRIRSLTEEIHRQMYIVSQARSTTATPAAQSGISKQEDAKPGSKALNGFGDAIRAGMKLCLERVGMVRGEELEVEVVGFQFDEDDASEDIAQAQRLEASQYFGSDTLKREAIKRVGHSYLRDAGAETLKQFDSEVEALPTIEQVAQEEERKQRDMIAGRLAASAKGKRAA